MKINMGFYNPNLGYIAGSGDGIVTVMGKPKSKLIYLFDAKTLQISQTARSLNNGHYIFTGLEVDKEYLVMLRDLNKEFEPFCWDWVKPANDLTFNEQKELWLSFLN